MYDVCSALLEPASQVQVAIVVYIRKNCSLHKQDASVFLCGSQSTNPPMAGLLILILPFI